MNHLIKLIVLLIIYLNLNPVFAKNENKLLFTVNDQAYTSIDLNKRILYLSLKNLELDNINKNLFIKDFYISVIFSKYYEDKFNNNINLEIIEEQYNNLIANYLIQNEKLNEIDIFNFIKKEDIINNIVYDIKRKMIIEKELNKKKDIIYSNNLNEINNIYDIYVSYISLNENHKINYEDFKLIKLNDIKDILKQKKIKYIYKTKKLNFTEKINKEIKKSIINNKDNFFIKKNNNIILGEIKRKIKNENNLSFSFFQITSNIKIKIDKIKCKNFIEFKKNKDYEINKIDNKLYKNLNNKIKENIIKIDDWILIKQNNLYQYILLCSINYNNKIFEEINISNKIDFLVNKIENDHIKSIEKKYNIIKYYK